MIYVHDGLPCVLFCAPLYLCAIVDACVCKRMCGYSLRTELQAHKRVLTYTSIERSQQADALIVVSHALYR